MTAVWDERKKGLEEEYFRRKDQDALEKTRRRLAAGERERRENVFLLYCPKCGEKMEEILFREIMVERCTGCHGVWLDSGEVERLTARAGQGWLSHFWRRFGR
jgi:hypothetical protein